MVGMALVSCISFLTAAALPNKAEPLFVIKSNGKYGYIDKNGKVKIKPQFDYAHDFSDGRALVGKQAGDQSTSKAGYINEQGKVIVPLVYDYAMDFSEGMAAAITYLEGGISNRFYR